MTIQEDHRVASTTPIAKSRSVERRLRQKRLVEAKAVQRLIEAKEEWLTNRVIQLAKVRGYTSQTSTLRKAWEASIQGLSQSIVAMIQTGEDVADIGIDTASSSGPGVLFGVEAARRHRTRGVTLGSFLGLMKSYREAYLDLVVDADLSPAAAARYRRMIGIFYDQMEIGFCSDWANEPQSAQGEQLRQQNRTLVNEKNKYLTIFESLQDPVFLVDSDGLVENMNFAAGRLFVSGAIPGGSYYGEVGDRELVITLLGRECLTGAECELDRRLQTNAGLKWFSIKTQPMLDVSEKFLGTVVILNDVTELYLAKERAEAAARSESDFIATMSHEIRTPIHGIVGIVELLQQSELSPKDRAYVDVIANSSDLLTSLVSDILDFSRIEAGNLEFEHVEFSIGSALDDVLRLMRPMIRRKPELRFVVEQPDLPRVAGDPGKLRQILINLAGNAVKFTDRGLVRIAVEMLDEGASRRTFRFSVSDTGVGIAPDRLDEIFKPFTQSDSSVARRYGGTGLGLAICRRIADQLGGQVGVISRLGEGSCFRLEIALDVVSAPLPDGTSDRVAGQRPPVRALELLVVEDNEVNALVASNLLAAAGHRVRVAASGEEALVAIAQGNFDLILMDLHLPDCDGFELAHVIRNLADHSKADVPIIALSARGQVYDADALGKAGINDYLGKPFHFAGLEAVLQRVAGVSSPRPIRGRNAEPDRATDGGNIEETVLRDHCEALGADAVSQIIATFRKSTAETARELAAYADSGRWSSVAATAHRLRSAARHVGLSALSRRAETVEAAARDHGEEAAAATLELVVACNEAPDQLDATWARIRQVQAEKT